MTPATSGGSCCSWICHRSKRSSGHRLIDASFIVVANSGFHSNDEERLENSEKERLATSGRMTIPSFSLRVVTAQVLGRFTGAAVLKIQ